MMDIYLGKGPQDLAERQNDLWRAGLLDAIVEVRVRVRVRWG